jgi:flagellar hook assembly protein FlgD
LEAVFDDGRLLTVAEGSIGVSAESRLGRPYPNPFRSTSGVVTVPFQTTLPGESVTMSVVDVRGRTLRSISRAGPTPAGFGSFQWDGHDRNGHRVPGGVYYIYVRGAGIQDARPVVYVP